MVKLVFDRLGMLQDFTEIKEGQQNEDDEGRDSDAMGDPERGVELMRRKPPGKRQSRDPHHRGKQVDRQVSE